MRRAFELADKLNSLCVAEFAWPYLNDAATELRRLSAEIAECKEAYESQFKELHAVKAELKAIKEAEPVAIGYMNSGHIYELQQKRIPYGYVYQKSGIGAELAVYTLEGKS